MHLEYFHRALLLLCLLGPGVAVAQSMTVIGGETNARDCYMSATLATQMNSASPQDLDSCDFALQHANLVARDRAATFLNRGIIYVALERYDDAKRDYDRARKMLPDSGEVYVNRGNIFFMGGVYDQAIAEYNHALDLDVAKKHIAYFNRAMAHEKLGNFESAREDYEKAAELSPQWAIPRTRLDRLQEKINSNT